MNEIRYNIGELLYTPVYNNGQLKILCLKISEINTVKNLEQEIVSYKVQVFQNGKLTEIILPKERSLFRDIKELKQNLIKQYEQIIDNSIAEATQQTQKTLS